MKYGVFSILVLIIFLVGYGIGRRVGIKEGYKQGVSYAPLKQKEEAYEDYSCPIEISQIDN